MDLALNNLQSLICHKTKQTKQTHDILDWIQLYKYWIMLLTEHIRTHIKTKSIECMLNIYKSFRPLPIYVYPCVCVCARVHCGNGSKGNGFGDLPSKTDRSNSRFISLKYFLERHGSFVSFLSPQWIDIKTNQPVGAVEYIYCISAEGHEPHDQWVSRLWR